MLKITAIETNIGFFIQSENCFCTGTSHGLDEYLFDGKKAEKTFSPKWLFLKDKPNKVFKIQSKQRVNHRFELKDKTVADKLSLDAVIFTTDSRVVKDENYDFYHLSGEMEKFNSLYEYKVDLITPEPQIIEFEFNVRTKIDKIINLEETDSKFSYPVYKTKWVCDGERIMTRAEISHYAIDIILFPDIVLPSRPCFLSSKESYDIVRKHILTNINPKVAKVNSDYDFCFSVQKLVELNEKEEYIVDVSSIKSKTPKWEKRYKNTRNVQIFEMTHSEANHKGYTVFPGFKADNETELKKTIDKFLSELMKVINRPVVDCPKCNGLGVLFDIVNTLNK